MQDIQKVIKQAMCGSINTVSKKKKFPYGISDVHYLIKITKILNFHQEEAGGLTRQHKTHLNGSQLYLYLYLVFFIVDAILLTVITKNQKTNKKKNSNQ